MTSETDADVSPAGKVYEQLVSAVTTAEFDRKKTLEGRGATIITTSTSLLALIFGLTVIVTGKEHLFHSHCAVKLLIASLAAFVLSAVIAIFIATYGTAYRLTGPETLEHLTDHKNWEDRTEDDARRMWVNRQVNTINTLRRGNDRKAKAVTWSLAVQVLAIALLSAAAAIEIRTWL
jgi:hypothetical protein